MRKSYCLRGGILGLSLILGGLAGCESGGGPPLPETGGAGIPGVKGPVSPTMPKRAAGGTKTAAPATQSPSPKP